MFGVTRERAGELKRLILRDEGTGEYASIVPAIGANLNALVLGKDGALHSVIDGNKTEADFFAGRNIFRSAVLFPFPNRIRDGAYTFEGKRYQLPLNFPEEHNACHGFVYDKPFTVEDTTAEEAAATATLAYRYDGSLAGYPFPFVLRLLYTLAAGKGFSCAVTVENAGRSPMPAGIGWHPYLTFGDGVDGLVLKLPPAERLEVDRQLVPTGAVKPYADFAAARPVAGARIDSCLRLTAGGEPIQASELTDPRTGATIRLWQEAGPGTCRYLQVYVPPERASIAIEPMTCSVDAFNNHGGLIIIPPGGSAHAAFGVTLA